MCVVDVLLCDSVKGLLGTTSLAMKSCTSFIICLCVAALHLGSENIESWVREELFRCLACFASSNTGLIRTTGQYFLRKLVQSWTNVVADTVCGAEAQDGDDRQRDEDSKHGMNVHETLWPSPSSLSGQHMNGAKIAGPNEMLARSLMSFHSDQKDSMHIYRRLDGDMNRFRPLHYASLQGIRDMAHDANSSYSQPALDTLSRNLSELLMDIRKQHDDYDDTDPLPISRKNDVKRE